MITRYYPSAGDPTPGEWQHRAGEEARPLGEKGEPIGPWYSIASLRGQVLNILPSGVDKVPAPAPEKPSNPKDEAAVDRASLGLVPVAALVEESLAWLEGLLKYGSHNYTIVGIRSSVYVFGCLRHVFKWWLGQERDPVTGVHHLGSARANLGALLDAQLRKKLHDDRPPSVPSEDVDALFDAASATIKQLVALFGSRKPRHYTIADTEHKP